jgi:hypothetical protein
MAFVDLNASRKFSLEGAEWRHLRSRSPTGQDFIVDMTATSYRQAVQTGDNAASFDSFLEHLESPRRVYSISLGALKSEKPVA